MLIIYFALFISYNATLRYACARFTLQHKPTACTRFAREVLYSSIFAVFSPVLKKLLFLFTPVIEKILSTLTF